MVTNMSKFLKNDRFAIHAGVKLTAVDAGYAKAEMEVADIHLNGVGIVHGAAIYTLADYAFAAASNSHEIVTVSVNTNISYFKPPKGRRLVAEAREISASRKLCTYNVDIFDDNEDLIARFTGMGYKRMVDEMGV